MRVPFHELSLEHRVTRVHRERASSPQFPGMQQIFHESSVIAAAKGALGGAKEFTAGGPVTPRALLVVKEVELDQPPYGSAS